MVRHRHRARTAATSGELAQALLAHPDHIAVVSGEAGA